jgi:hypothetical protein
MFSFRPLAVKQALLALAQAAGCWRRAFLLRHWHIDIPTNRGALSYHPRSAVIKSRRANWFAGFGEGWRADKLKPLAAAYCCINCSTRSRMA